MRINKHDTQGTKPLLSKSELGYDDYAAGGDVGRVYVGTGTENIALAKKTEVIAVDGKADAHIARVDNPHNVTKSQVGLANVDNTADASKNVLSATKWTAARTITLSGDIAGSASVDGSANVTITTTVQPNSVALGTDTTGNYVAGATAGTGISISGTAGEGWSPTITNTAPNVTTDITTTHNTTNVVVNSSDGTDGTINGATQTLAGVMTAADKVKLDGVAAGATANVGTVTSIATSGAITGGTITTTGTISHSTSDGYLHVPATGTTNNGKVLTAGATAGSLSWTTIPSAPVTSVAGKTGVVTLVKDDVGLSLVDNTADSAKNVLSATKLTTARTITLSGDVSGNTSFDGSGNVSLVATVANDSHTHTFNNLTSKPTTLQGYGINPEELPTGENLDTKNITGLYCQSQNGDASLALNYPVATAGLLEVFAYGSMIHQRYWAYNTDNIYYRAKYSAGAWTPWTKGANVDDNVLSATKLQTARTIELSGGATGTATLFDGTGNISIPVTGLNASNLSSGTVPDDRLSGVYSGMSLKLDSNNTVFTTESSGSTNISRTVYGLAEYKNNTSTATGAIVFIAPSSHTAVMHQLEVSGLLHNQNIVSLIVQGYRTSGNWSDLRKISTGTADIQARWGVTPDDKSCLILGDVGTVWSYPHIAITRAMFSYTGVSDVYCTGWTVALVTDFTGYTNISANISDSTMTGNVSTATKLQTARTISLSGGVTGSASFDGSKDITIEAAVADDSHAHIIANVDGLQNALNSKANTSYVDNKYSGFKNYIINGGFDVWQRGTSFSNVGAPVGAYTADRWHVRALGAETGRINIERNSSVLTNSAYILRLTTTNTNGTGAYYIEQKIENPLRFRSKTVTFSALVRAQTGSAFMGKNIIAMCYMLTTTGYINIGEFSRLTMQNNWQTLSGTLTFNNMSEYTFDSSAHIIVRLALDDNNINGFIDIANVQLEEGSVATPFEQRPYGLELSLCQERAIDLYGASYRATLVTVNSLQFRLPIQLSPLGGVSSLLSGVGDGTDWGIVNINGTLVTGFTLSLVSVTNGYAQIAASKTSHGLSDGYITFSTPNKNILSKEI